MYVSTQCISSTQYTCTMYVSTQCNYKLVRNARVTNLWFIMHMHFKFYHAIRTSNYV